MSMLRTIRHRGQRADICLVHSVPHEDDLLFADELAGLAADNRRWPKAVSVIQLRLQ